jgi:integrase
MASVRRRPLKDGKETFAVVYNLDGVQTSTSFRPHAGYTSAQAKKDADAFRDAVNKLGARRAMEVHNIPFTKKTAPKAAGPTVMEWLDRHIKSLTGVEQKTIDDYNRYADKDIGPFLGDIPLATLAEQDIAAWVKHLETTDSARGRPRSPKTIKNIHGFLSGALGAAVKVREIPVNPAAGRRLPKGGGDETEVIDRLLSHDEFNRLLDATTDYWKPLVEFMVASGCRWGEVSALKPADVDREAGTVRIRRAWKKSSKGYETGPPKTKRSRRVIDIDHSILDKLDYSHEYLFVNRDGGPVRYAGFRRRVWDKAVARAKLEPPPTPHALRHTCGSWMLNAGVPIIIVSRHLGHESVQVTVDIYGHLDRSVSSQAAAVMGELLARKPQKAITAAPPGDGIQS